MSPQPTLLFRYLDTTWWPRDWLCDWRVIRSVKEHRGAQPAQLFGDSVWWVDAAQYLQVTLDSQLTWSIGIHQVGKYAAQRLDMLGRLLAMSGYLILSMVACSCSILKSDVLTDARKLHVLKSQCLSVAPNACLYLRNKQIEENLATPFFADHFGELEGTGADQGMIRVVWV